MNNQSAIEILNELLMHESQSLLSRLGESTVFVSWACADEQQIVSSMIQEETQHRAWLVEAIRDLGGDPLPVRADIQSTNVHYLDLSFVLPRALKDRNRLLASYESAAAQIGSNPRAGSVIAKIAERHRKHIRELSTISDQRSVKAKADR